MGPHERYFQKHRDFYHAYGIAMSLWASVERGFADLFVAITGMQATVGQSVFFSARSFQGRADMFLAATDHARTVPAGRAFLRDAMNLAKRWQSTRNQMAHDMHELVLEDGEIEGSLAITSRGGAQLRVAEMEQTAKNLFQLMQLLTYCRGTRTLLREPELCGELLALLPRDSLRAPKDPTAIGTLLGRIEQSPD